MIGPEPFVESVAFIDFVAAHPDGEMLAVMLGLDMIAGLDERVVGHDAAPGRMRS